MRELLPLLPKPSRYTGIEEGSVHKRPDDCSLRVALAFPDMYEVGMSYLGQKILYSLLNEQPAWRAERVFTPCREAGAVLRAHNSPLCTLESDTPLRDMDCIGFSVTHELCYTNCLYILDLAGIPLRAAHRQGTQADGKPWPLIVAGGGCTLSAEPLAPFMDLMVLGEGEESLPELLRLFEASRDKGLSRREFLLEATRLPGVYVPEFFAETTGADAQQALLRPLVPHHTHAVRRIVPDMNAAPYPAGQSIPFGAVHNRLALEIGRGCTRGCRFCQAGNLYRPARERSPAQLRELLETCLSDTGYDDVSFLSLSTGDYSALKELFMSTVDRCAHEQVSVSLPSLRVGSIDDAIMERMAGIRRTGATLAPEAGSQRLRDVINKGITENDLILHVQKLFEHGWQQIKLYFMIGLPTETDDDLLSIVDLCKKARDAAGPGIKRLQITAAVSPFVPKPHTPFQWEAQISYEEIRRRVGVLLDAMKKEKRIKMRWHEPAMTTLEGVFSRGDRRLADVVESAYRKGAIFADWIEDFSLAPWVESLAEHGLSVEEYTRGRSLEEPLPWDHLHSGLSKDFLQRERERAFIGATTPDCRYAHCNACGVCDVGSSASLLERLPGMAAGQRYSNILNNPQRDQQAHSVRLDRYGRVIVRQGPYAAAQEATDEGGREENPAETAHADSASVLEEGFAIDADRERVPPANNNAAKAKPPALAPHLIKKAAQLRLWYARTGNAAYLSQLELQNIFDRALRRAALPLAFSQGFHPLPLVSFGRALPVGVASECEWFSVYLREERPTDGLIEAINPRLPKGVVITRIEPLSLEKTHADTDQETYCLELLDTPERQATFADAWEKIARTANIPWKRETKKGIRELDARAFFSNIHCGPDLICFLRLDWSKGYVSPLALCREALAQAGFPTELTRLRLTKIE